MSDPTVEAAGSDDEEAVMELCRLLHAENAMFEMSEDKVRYWIRRAINKDRGLIGVIRVDHKLVGAVCLFVDCFWYTTQEHLEEFFNFVHPDHRKSNYATLLVEYAKRCSDELRELPLFIGIVSTNRTASKIRLYSRRLTVAGAFFIHNMQYVKNNLVPAIPDFCGQIRLSQTPIKSDESDLSPVVEEAV